MFDKVIAYLEFGGIIMVIFVVVFVNRDLMNIKEKYGEKMMHLCRKNFSTILETPGLLFELLSSHFDYSRFLYDDIINNSLEDMFKNYIYSLLTPENEELAESFKNPFELLNDVGYDLYECFCEDDVQFYRKYYASGEELCSFRGGRLDECYVFFAIKKDVDEIKREDYINPMRQDRYGTSVISIQFTKGNVNMLSIKNRYNHRVINPDATYSNNLENIVPGLTRSFEKYYNLNINQNMCGSFEIPGYVLANDGKYYKYNYEINNIYYCSDNIIIDNFEVVKDYQEKEKYLIVDYFIIDLVNKKISLYDKNVNDSFIDDFDNIEKINIVKDKNNGSKKISICLDGGSSAYIVIDKYNRIISYKNEFITEIKDNFMCRSIYLEDIDISNILRIGNNFLNSNMCIKEIFLNKLLSIGDGFLSDNKILNKINLDNVMTIGNFFLCENIGLKNLDVSKLEKVGYDFIEKNKNISYINMPNLIYVADGFLRYNKCLKEVSLPKLEYIGINFIAANKIMEKIYLPMLIQVGSNFLFSNLVMNTIRLDNLKTIGHNFMYCNRELKDVVLSSLVSVGMKFLYKNNSIEKLELSELVKTGKYFMYENNSLKILLVPKLEKVDIGFLMDNEVLEYIYYETDRLDGYVRWFDNNTKRKILKI